MNKKYSNLDFAYEEMQPGPPTGRALQVEIIGENYATSKIVAGQLMEYLKSVKGVTTIESDILPGDAEIRIEFDRSVAAYTGIDLSTAVTHIRAAVGGLRVATTRLGADEIDITIRFPETSYAQQLRQLETLQIPNERGGMVTISKVAKFVEHPGFTNIRHKNNRRVVNVLANIDPNLITSNLLNAKVAEEQEKWLSDTQSRQVLINYGGENEKNNHY